MSENRNTTSYDLFTFYADDDRSVWPGAFIVLAKLANRIFTNSVVGLYNLVSFFLRFTKEPARLPANRTCQIENMQIVCCFFLLHASLAFLTVANQDIEWNGPVLQTPASSDIWYLCYRERERFGIFVYRNVPITRDMYILWFWLVLIYVIVAAILFRIHNLL